jgi:hypothetical protein
VKRATPEQQAARINVDDTTWRRFRVLALEADRSIADYLGGLVRDELRRASRGSRASDAADAASSPPEGVGGGSPGRATRSLRGNSRRVRLSDVDVLEQLPGADRGPSGRNPRTGRS